MVNASDPNPIEAAKAEIIGNAKTARKKLHYLLEKEAEKDEMDMDELLKYYRYASANPVWALAEDIQKQSSMYSNKLEEIKQQRVEETRFPKSDVAIGIKEQYENLGLIDSDLLPNRSLAELGTYVVGKTSSFGRGLLKLLMEHGKALMQEFHCEQGTTSVLQVQIGWSLAFHHWRRAYSDYG